MHVDIQQASQAIHSHRQIEVNVSEWSILSYVNNNIT